MSDYRNEYRQFQREYFWTLPRAVVAAVAGLLLLSVVLWSLGVLSVPFRLVSRTLETDNIITSYERFRDINQQVKARSAQIAGHRKIIADNKDMAEASRLRIELAAMQQSCRELVARYNADASKINKAIFRGDAPDSLNPSICE